MDKILVVTKFITEMSYAPEWYCVKVIRAPPLGGRPIGIRFVCLSVNTLVLTR